MATDFHSLDLPDELAGVAVVELPSHVQPIQRSDAERQVIDDLEDGIQEFPQSTFAARVEAALDRARQQADGAGPADLLLAAKLQGLRVWWWMARGLEAGSGRQYSEAIECWRQATYGFAALGDEVHAEEAIVQCLNNDAARLIQENRRADALATLEAVAARLSKSKVMDATNRMLRIATEVEITNQRSTLAFQAGNAVLAEQLLRQAAERLASLATEDDSETATHDLAEGQAGMIRAQADLMSALSTISLYGFDRVVPGRSEAAAHAADLLKKLSPANAAAADFYAELLGVIERLASVMLRIMGASFANRNTEFAALRARVAAARASIPRAAGLDPVQLVQVCDQVDLWLGNLERLTKPKSSDWGRLGGLVACVAFCVVLVAVAAINEVFDLKADAAAIFGPCLTLAVVAGLGVPGLLALKGKSVGGSPEAG